MKQGLLITFEGPDGSGKSTQIRLLTDFLINAGYDVHLTREPGGTVIGEKIREVLLDTAHGEMGPETEALLYAAARAQHVSEVIRPALEEGKMVICDRFTDSSIAYQSYGRGLGEAVREINRFATGGLGPDLTILLLLDPEEGRKRAESTREPDRLELEGLAFHRKVYHGYKRLAQEEPERVLPLDADGEIDKIQREIRKRVYPFLEERGHRGREPGGFR